MLWLHVIMIQLMTYIHSDILLQAVYVLIHIFVKILINFFIEI